MFCLTEARVCEPYICQIRLPNDTPVTAGSVISTFHDVWEPYGRHFNRTTGKFVAPDDGCYLIMLTLLENDVKMISIEVLVGDTLRTNIMVKSAHTSAAGSVVVDMSTGEELCFRVAHAEQGAKLQAVSRFVIIKLANLERSPFSHLSAILRKTVFTNLFD